VSPGAAKELTRAKRNARKERRLRSPSERNRGGNFVESETKAALARGERNRSSGRNLERKKEPLQQNWDVGRNSGSA